MKKTVYATLLMGFFFALYWAIRPSPIWVETTQVTKGDFIEVLNTEGKLRSRSKQTIYAFANGNVENLKVKVGDLVEKGQVITVLDWDVIKPVRSPIKGVISKIFRESAGPILRGDPIFEVSELTDLEVVSQIRTPDAVKILPGSDAKIHNWGGKGFIKGEVSHISKVGAVVISALGVEEEKTEVRIGLKDIPQEIKDRLGDTYHVDVEFILSSEKEVLSVPLGALFKSGDIWSVYVIKQGRAKMREVKIKKQNDNQALISQGLSEGERVIVFPGDKVFENTRVEYK